MMQKYPPVLLDLQTMMSYLETKMLQNLLKVARVNVDQRKCKMKNVIQGNHLHLSLNSFRSDMIQVTKIAATRATMVKRSNA